MSASNVQQGPSCKICNQTWVFPHWQGFSVSGLEDDCTLSILVSGASPQVFFDIRTVVKRTFSYCWSVNNFGLEKIFHILNKKAEINGIDLQLFSIFASCSKKSSRSVCLLMQGSCQLFLYKSGEIERIERLNYETNKFLNTTPLISGSIDLPLGSSIWILKDTMHSSPELDIFSEAEASTHPAKSFCMQVDGASQSAAIVVRYSSPEFNDWLVMISGITMRINQLDLKEVELLFLIDCLSDNCIYPAVQCLEEIYKGQTVQVFRRDVEESNFA